MDKGEAEKVKSEGEGEVEQVNEYKGEDKGEGEGEVEKVKEYKGEGEEVRIRERVGIRTGARKLKSEAEVV